MTRSATGSPSCSDHEGWGNVYSRRPRRLRTCAGTPTTAAPTRRFYARHAAHRRRRGSSTSRPASCGSLDSLEPTPSARRLDVRLGGPRTAREPHRVHGRRRGVGDVARTAPAARASSTVRGTVHRLTHRDGPARTLLAEPGRPGPAGRARSATTGRVVGRRRRRRGRADGRAGRPARRRRAAAGPAPVGRPGAGAGRRPGRRGVAAGPHDGRLLVVDSPATTARSRELARGADGEISGLAWSPDSPWLAYADPRRGRAEPDRDDPPGRRHGRRGHRAAVRRHRRRSSPRTAATWPSCPGAASTRSTTSTRSTCPSRPSWRPFLVPLAAPHARPVRREPGRAARLARRRDGRRPAMRPSPTTVRGGRRERRRRPMKSAKDADKDAPPEVVIDVDGLADRVVPIPVGEGRYSGMGAAKGCLLWYRSPVEGVLGDRPRRTTRSRTARSSSATTWCARKLDVIADPVSRYAVSGDGTRLVVRDGETLRVLRVGPLRVDARRTRATPTSSRSTPGGIVVTVDPAAEWRQMYDEAGRLMRDHFWVDDMAGVDWAGGAGPVPAAGRRGGQPSTTSSTCCGRSTASWARRTRTCPGGGGGDWSGGPGCSGADLAPGRRRLAGRPGAAAARRRRRTRAARWPGRASTCGPAT